MSPQSTAILTAYRAQLVKFQGAIRVLRQANPKAGWLALHLLTAGAVQAEEYDVVILSLVQTRGGRESIGESERANVVCTR